MPQIRRNSRMRRLASHLSVIRILLNPPSPPTTDDDEEEAPESPDIPISPHCNPRTPPPYAHQRAARHLPKSPFRKKSSTVLNPAARSISTVAAPPASCFLQVPRMDSMTEDMPRLYSPPPRRCSNSSAYSEQSTSSSLSGYPALLSPAATQPSSSRSNSFASYSYSDDNETPPNELLPGALRPVSTQSTPAGNVSPSILLSPVLSRPVRSQSAHSPPLLRHSIVGTIPHHHLTASSSAHDSDSETGHTLMGGLCGSDGSRATTACDLHHLMGSTTPSGSMGALGRFGSVGASSALQRHGSSASDSGSIYGYFYKRQSFRAHRDSTNSGSSSLNILPPPHSSQTMLNDPDAHHSPQHPHPLSHHHSPSPQMSLHRMAVQLRASPSTSLQRSHSEAQPDGHLPERAMSIHSATRPFLAPGRKSGFRRPSACVPTFRGSMTASTAGDFGALPLYADSPSGGNHAGHSNIARSRNTLGHSDPQLYTYSTSPCGRRGTAVGRAALHLSPASAIRFRKNSIFVGGHGHNRAHRMSVLSAHGPDSSSSEPTSGVQSNPSSTCAIPRVPSVRRRRRPLVALNSGGDGTAPPVPRGVRSGSSLAAPYLLHHHPNAADNRRWSLASLPSSSGYGTPGSISALSSEYSSQEQLVDLLGDLRFSNRYDSNDSYPSMEEGFLLGAHRPRSRSLSSPVRMGAESVLDTSLNAMSQLYKERFPKAKTQMENRLQQFLSANAPLSGFTSAISFERPASPLNFADPQSDAASSSSQRLPPRQLSFSQQHSPTLTSHHRPSSPRPTSPIPRPISPLATDSATQIEPGKVVFRSSSHHNNSQLGCTTPYGNSSGSVVGSFAAAYAAFPAPTAVPNFSHLTSDSQSTTTTNSTSRRSTMAAADSAAPLNPALLRVLAEGATRFIHHQICEIAADCLQKSRDDMLTSGYFCEMSIRLEESLSEARLKTSAESLKFLASISKQLLMIVSRTARLLESLEFDPDEFYRLLEETEGAIRFQLGSGEARVPDLPQYIIDKLGLNKNLITDRSTPPELIDDSMVAKKPADNAELPHRCGAECSERCTATDAPACRKDTAVAEDQLRALTANAPKEEDFESIRLISNGAYGAVYLVRHRKTRQRFALKKMKKQTLLLRNQVEQVYAERDILTFTDNPFVVCFYGSFETKQHLCMLMEYVEGGDCASLLKSAGVLPIEVARLYVAETVLAIEYLHSCGIVHRDLKPDNLLITSIGHIKLTDFGLSKIGLMNRTTLVSEGYVNDTQQFKDNQLCGTPEYIAPEVILRQGYGKPVDWWALGIILYEFLVGIVPFLGSSPEELFTNIINEDVEYPDGDEALEPNAQDLIQMLLEKNPVDRLGTMGGAADVAAHPFFLQLDFHSLLRQKAEFVPNLESEEDTSYFDSRTDRYNHDAESGDDEAVPMFWSFSTASPRHSMTAQEIPMAQLAALRAAASPTLSPAFDEFRAKSPDPTVATTSSLAPQASSSSANDTPDSGLSNPPTLPTTKPEPPLNPDERYDDPTSPSAIILRQRFSAQRAANYSTSSSGTTGTGCLNTCSSTDSSMDASYLLLGDPMTAGAVPTRRQTTNFSPLPRFAISSCDQQPPGSPTTVAPSNQPRRATLSAEPEAHQTPTPQPSPNAAKRTESLRVFIPQQTSASPSNSTTPTIRDKSGSQASVYYHAQPSPDNQSQSSLSSFEPNSPQPPPHPPASPIPSTSKDTVAPPVLQTSNTVGKPVVIRKGTKGYGFTIRSVRVYLSEVSDYYTIEHIVAAVREPSPAYDAGLRENDLITHVHTQPVHNMTHPQLMHRLLSSCGEITLHVVPLNSTTIKEGDARRSVGKLLRKKPRRPQQQRRPIPMEKKSRKTSSLFRRLSGKRGTADIVPGTSTQKQSFMPRSASSQDGVALSLSPAPMSQLLNEPQIGMGKSENEPKVSTSLTVSGHQSPRQSISHRRASGQLTAAHQLPGVEEEQPRKKQSTELTAISRPRGNSATANIVPTSVGHREILSRHGRRSMHENVPVYPSSLIARNSTSTAAVSLTVPPVPPPPPVHRTAAPSQPAVAPPIPRPSTLIERKISSSERKPSTSSRTTTAAVDLQRSASAKANERKKEPESIHHLSIDAATTSRRSVPNETQPSVDHLSAQSKREAAPKRPPMPTRKLSPSRLVQRLFRGSSSTTNSTSGSSSTQSKSHQ